MKKFCIVLLAIFSLFVVSCNKDDDNKQTEYTSLKILSVNDFHGALEEEEGEYGAARLAWYIEKERAVDGQAVLLLGAGDMFQGTAISNYSYGLNVVKVMNQMGFDAMTIGNHEFDWDFSTVLGYVDHNAENGEADFPFLACNIIQKDTNAIPEYVDEYEIVDYGSFKVGIIGYIGSTLESDISASKVENYEFVDPVNRISELAAMLRTEQNCDLVIAMGHDAASYTNMMISNLSGDSAVDAIINGHTHTTYVDSLNNGNGEEIPVTQAGSSGEYITEIVFEFDKAEDDFSAGVADNLDMSLYGMDKDPIVDTMIKEMSVAIEPIMGEEISTAGKYVSKSAVCGWTANAIYEAIDCDLAAINSGGIRQYAFPIAENTTITVKKIYEIMPFDNLIKTCQVKGSDLRNILLINDAVFSSNVETVGNTFYIDGVELDNDQIYVFACVDYLFDRDSEIYEKGQETEILQVLVRDVMIDALRKLKDNNQKWLD